jgi:hypothetical protein
MKKSITVTLFLFCMLSARAEDSMLRLDGSGNSRSGTQWDTSNAHWDQVLSETQSSQNVRLGKSDFVVTGPLIEGFHRKQFSSDVSLGQRILAFPIVNLFVPRRMPSPPGGTGRYFAWRGESARPWVSVSAGSPPGSAFSSINNEPSTPLILINYH